MLVQLRFDLGVVWAALDRILINLIANSLVMLIANHSGLVDCDRVRILNHDHAGDGDRAITINFNRDRSYKKASIILISTPTRIHARMLTIIHLGIHTIIHTIVPAHVIAIILIALIATVLLILIAIMLIILIDITLINLLRSLQCF